MADEIIIISERSVNWIGPNHIDFIAAVEPHIPKNMEGKVGIYETALSCGNLYGFSLVWRAA